MTRLLLITLAFLAAVAAAGQRTTRRGLKADRSSNREQVAVIAPDTLWNPGDRVAASGYDKPLNSRKESLHLTNNTARDIVGAAFTITYTDFRGNELHRRTVEVPCEVPASSTRLVTFPSWDLQNSFYFRGGAQPRKQAYPYDISLTVDYILANPE